MNGNVEISALLVFISSMVLGIWTLLEQRRQRIVTAELNRRTAAIEVQKASIDQQTTDLARITSISDSQAAYIIRLEGRQQTLEDRLGEMQDDIEKCEDEKRKLRDDLDQLRAEVRGK